MRHNPGYGIMATFVQERGVKVVGVPELCQCRHGDEVLRGDVHRLIAAGPDLGLGSADKGVHPGHSVQLGKGLGLCQYLGQAVDLGDIEHRVGAQHRDKLGLILLADPEFLGEHDDRAVFALPDGGLEPLGLLEGQPLVSVITLRDCLAP